MKHEIRLRGALARNNAITAVQNAPDGYIVTVRPETRSQEQNRLLWAVLRDFEQQAWLADRQWKSEDWKLFLLSAFRNEAPVPGIDGEPVNLRIKTSTMTKREFTDFIDFIYAKGNEWGVVWSDPALAVYEEYLNGRPEADYLLGITDERP